MKEISLPWGRDDEVRLSLPSGWRLKGVLEPEVPPDPPDFRNELARSLEEPIGLPRLREFARGKKTAAVVIDDRTRPTPVAEMLPLVVSELGEAGIGESDVVVVIALGTHRAMTADEIRERVGALDGRIEVVNHDYQDRTSLVFAGKSRRFGIPCQFNRRVMESGVVVSLGSIEAHEQAGFGGGYKNFMPGVSDPEPIRRTHNFKFQRPIRVSNSGMPREQCRFRQAVDDCGELLGDKVFIVNTVFVRGLPVAVVSGHPLAAHARGREIYSELAMVRLPGGPADVVISDAAPLDLDLRVTMKSCFNSAAALKPGGLFICVSRAAEGQGDLRVPERLPSVAKHFIKRVPLGLLAPLALRFNVSPDQAMGTISVITMLQRFSKMLFLTSKPGGLPAFRSMGMEFFTDPESVMGRAAELAASAEVLVLPHGGASFVAWD